MAGKPLLAHSIIHARQVSAFRCIVVSTDDAEINSLARELGAEVVLRPPEISGDKASSNFVPCHGREAKPLCDRFQMKVGHEMSHTLI